MKKLTKVIYYVIGSLMAVLFIGALINYFISDDISVKDNCLFACGQAALFMLVNFVPLIMQKLKLEVPDFVYVVFIIFCVAHFLLGEILGFFALVSWWDSALHAVSGALIAILACSVIKLFNKTKDSEGSLTLSATLVSAFCITITVGVIWEIVEFVMDCIFGLNMQRAYLSNPSGERGAALLGQEALLDTMKDLILDALGAIVVCIVIYIIAKKKNMAVDKLVLIKRKGEDVQSKSSSLQENKSE